jgi:transcriptional regulator with XRE-family HTH domain
MRRVRNRLLILMTEKERQLGRRITRKEIAEAIDVSQHTIASWLRNDLNKFEAHMIERLCNYFQCEIWDLLVLEEISEDS